MAYVGRSVEYGNAATDSFVGNGGATYTLTYETPTAAAIISLDGVIQKNGTDFNITGTSLVFTSVVAAPIVIQVVYLGLSLSLGTPADNTVATAKLVNNAVDETKLKDALVGDFTDATVTASDTFLHGDATDSGNTKRDTIQGILDLVPATANEITKQSGAPTVSSPATPTVGNLILATSTGQMYSCSVVSSGANEWINIGDGTGSIEPVTYTAATGGSITTSGNYKIHTFTSSGTFEVTTVGDVATADFLVIAGGGSGGSGHAGGGGAGGYRNSFNSEASGGGGASESAFTTTAVQYTVTVGGGGAGVTSNAAGTSGGVSSIVHSGTSISITTVGGGGGGSQVAVALVGGSGGGGGAPNGAPGAAKAGTANQGYAGGLGQNYTSSSPYQFSGGGGGGSSAVGADFSGLNGGAGGNGLASSITGSAVTRAGGGGGCASSASDTAGAAGTGGASAGSFASGSTATDAAAVNTGSGSGGDRNGGTSGNGGSGIVIIRYQYQ